MHLWTIPLNFGSLLSGRLHSPSAIVTFETFVSKIAVSNIACRSSAKESGIIIMPVWWAIKLGNFNVHVRYVSSPVRLSVVCNVRVPYSGH